MVACSRAMTRSACALRCSTGSMAGGVGRSSLCAGSPLPASAVLSAAGGVATFAFHLGFAGAVDGAGILVGTGAGGGARRAGDRRAALRVGQGQAQGLPAGVRQFAPQRPDDLGPVRAFAIARDQDHHALGFGAVGRQPEGEETLVAGLQDLLALFRQLAFQAPGLVLAAFADRRALHCRRLLLGAFFLGMGGGRPQQRGGQQQGEGLRRVTEDRHRRFLIAFSEGQPKPWPVLCQAEPSHGSPPALAVRYARFPFRSAVSAGCRRHVASFLRVFLLPAAEPVPRAEEAPPGLPLTAELQAWLAGHRELRVGVVTEVPYAQYDRRLQRYSGANVELMGWLAAIMQVTLQWQGYPDQAALDEALRDGRVDIAPRPQPDTVRPASVAVFRSLPARLAAGGGATRRQRQRRAGTTGGATRRWPCAATARLPAT
ncbi:sensory box histidine kinase [Pseudomonas aeruginosa]|nr:sensory box histidine kinase [Pseudomonas aeruginosa]